jgi:two-component system response regulator PhcR
MHHSTRTSILHVEDVESERKNFVRYFGEEYPVLPALDAHAAIALLRSLGDRIGIIVIDEKLSGPSGSGLLHQVGIEFPHIIRILTAERAGSDLLKIAVNSGEIFRVIEKPIDPALAANALHQAANQLQTRRARNQRMQAIDETMTFLTHELNTPLAAILNFARGMQRRLTDISVSPQQQAEIWKASLAVDENVRNCIALLSSFSETLKSASIPAQPQENTAYQLVSSMLDHYPLSHEQRKMVRIELEEDFPVSTLPNCVSLVLSSLLEHTLSTLRDTSAPSVCFTVTAGDHPHIRISNNGPGIPPEILDKLMLDSVATHAESGEMERNLSFCKRIMQVFGGEMMIRSVQGVYTTITLYFPPHGQLRS